MIAMRRRILLLVTDLKIGGTPTVVRELALRLHDPAAGVEVEEACLAPWGPTADAIAAGGIRVTALDADDVFDLPMVTWKLLGLIREHQIDTVFSFLLHANLISAIAGRFCRGVRFFQSIQTTQSKPRWHWRVQRWIAAAAEKIVVPSDSVAQVAMERSGIERDQLRVIANGVNLHDFTSRPDHARKKSASNAGFNIAFIGRLDPVKRIDDLVRAMLRLSPRDVRLNIYGDGEQRATLRKLIDQLTLSERVVLHGNTPAAAALSASGLLVLPSEAEGFGLVLIEAMAAGVPIVATYAPGIRDVIRDGQTGLLVPVGDVDALAAAIDQLASDASLRQRLIENGREAVHRRYTWDRILPLYRRELGLTNRRQFDEPSPQC